MSLKHKINWVVTGIAFSLLKRSLRNRLQGSGASWLQQVAKGAKLYNRAAFILDASQGKRVVHIGFTDHPFTAERIENGTLLHSAIKKVATKVVGLDNNKEAISVYSNATRDDAVLSCDITKEYPGELTEFQPELILVPEVLEHLADPYRAVEVLFKSFSAGTKILVTVPNYVSVDSLAAGLNETESIHADHCWYFSPYTLQKLFDKKRFELQSIDFGMYLQPGSRVNPLMKQYPHLGDCLIAVFLIKKETANE